jgi:hypothetical protein
MTTSNQVVKGREESACGYREWVVSCPVTSIHRMLENVRLESSSGLLRCLYSPNFRQGLFSETPIHPLGCLCVRTGAKGRFSRRRDVSSRHLATRLDRYSLLQRFALLLVHYSHRRCTPFTEKACLRVNESMIRMAQLLLFVKLLLVKAILVEAILEDMLRQRSW